MSDTPRTDKMVESIKGMSEFARARNLAFLCRKLERQLKEYETAIPSPGVQKKRKP